MSATWNVLPPAATRALALCLPTVTAHINPEEHPLRVTATGGRRTCAGQEGQQHVLPPFDRAREAPWGRTARGGTPAARDVGMMLLSLLDITGPLPCCVPGDAVSPGGQAATSEGWIRSDGVGRFGSRFEPVPARLLD